MGSFFWYRGVPMKCAPPLKLAIFARFRSQRDFLDLVQPLLPRLSENRLTQIITGRLKPKLEELAVFRSQLGDRAVREHLRGKR